MKVKLVIAASALAAMQAFAQAQQGGGPPNAPMPTQAEVQRVVEMIRGDKTKTQQYCEIGKLNEQMAQADQKKDTKTVEALGKHPRPVSSRSYRTGQMWLPVIASISCTVMRTRSQSSVVSQP
jgi:hypothetical protein